MNTEEFNILLQNNIRMINTVDKYFNYLICKIPEKENILREQYDNIKENLLHDFIKISVKELISQLKIAMNMRFNIGVERTEFSVLKKYIDAIVISNEILNSLHTFNISIHLQEFDEILYSFNWRYKQNIKKPNSLSIEDLNEFCEFLGFPSLLKNIKIEYKKST